jgi:hypothetical protein
MNNQLYLIQKKISSIQYGILRWTDGEEQKSTQVKVVVNSKDSVNCKIIDSENLESLLHKHVNIVQKYHEDYLFASGEVTNEAKNTHIVSVKLTKASWFTKVQRGNISWLQEVQKYDPLELKIA